MGRESGRWEPETVDLLVAPRGQSRGLGHWAGLAAVSVSGADGPTKD
jgi:hypothetical protein